MIEATIPLPAPTNRVVEGPRFTTKGAALRLEYDVEDENGSISWHSVRFDEVLDFEFRSIAVCADTDVVPSTVVRRRSQSERRSNVVAAWDKAVGWQDWNQEQGGSSRFSEYSLFFDDVGALVVIASRCTPNG